MSAPSGAQLDAWCQVLGLRLVEVSRPPVLAALVGLLRHMGYGVIPSEALTRIDRDLNDAWSAEHGSTVRELLFATATGALSAHVALTSGRDDFGDAIGIPVRAMAAERAPVRTGAGGFHQGADGTAHPLDECGEGCAVP